MENTKPKSENRRKKTVIGVRVSEAERVEIETKAAALEMTAPAYLRRCSLTKVETEGMARPSLDKVLLSRILAELGKSGSNLNQIAHRLNLGQGVTPARLLKVLDQHMIALETILKTRSNDTQGNKA